MICPEEGPIGLISYCDKLFKSRYNILYTDKFLIKSKRFACIDDKIFLTRGKKSISSLFKDRERLMLPRHLRKSERR